MTTLAPLYREHHTTWHADTCAALERAAAAGKVRLEALVHGGYPGRPLPPRSLPGLCSVGHWDAAERQDWGLEPHRNEGIELTFLERGRLPFTVDGRQHPLAPGDLTVTRPWQAHQVGSPLIGPSRLHWVIFDVGVRRPNQAWQWPRWIVLDPAELAELTAILRQNERPVWPASAELAACFVKLGRLVEQAGQGAVSLSRLAVHLNELFVLLLEMMRRQPGPLNATLTSTQHTVELFLNDLRNPASLAHPWTLPAMAGHCGLGVTRFVHYCKQLTNLGPMHYLNHCRIEAAARLLLAEPAMSISEVAAACGFASCQYFATVFSQMKGTRPSEYRGRG